MMRIASFVLPLLAGCSTMLSDRPDYAVIDKIEGMLSSNPCIGPLDRWARKYAFALDTETGGADRRKVNFAYSEAGKFEFRKGRVVVRPRDFPSLDDRSYLVATGSYLPSTGEIEISACGPNVEE